MLFRQATNISFNVFLNVMNINSQHCKNIAYKNGISARGRNNGHAQYV